MSSNKNSLRKTIIIIVIAVLIACFVVYFIDKQKNQELDSRKVNIGPKDDGPTKMELATALNSHIETKKRLLFLKNNIENRDGYKSFYDRDGKIKVNELDIQNLFDLTWAGTRLYVAKNVNNGRGAADFIISFGADNISIVEFKLASNRKLKSNLQFQTKIYQTANNTQNSHTAIVYFSKKQEVRVKNILNELELLNDDNIVLIDARPDNKPSASTIS